MSANRSFLQRVLHREVKTFYSISEILECGHRFDSDILLTDALTAKHRVCQKCAQSSPKKQPMSETAAWRKIA